MIKNVDEIEFLNIKKVNVNNKEYTIYFDTESYTKVLICDDCGEIINDKETIKEIMEMTFKKASDIHFYNDFEEENDNKRVKCSEEERKKIIENVVKIIFFKKFGKKVISEEELDNKLDKNVKSVYLIDYGERNYEGIYNSKDKSIDLCTIDFNKKNIYISVVFHEFVHGIVGDTNGAIKKISIFPLSSKDEIDEYEFEQDYEYEYGNGIDEGIVSYIESMNNAREWEKFSERGSYDLNRNLVVLLATLYDNVSNRGKNNFFEQYILDSSGTLGRINDIFEEYVRDKNPDKTDREIKLLSMRKSFNFVISVDEILKSEDKNIDNGISIFQECVDELSEIFEFQILRKKLENDRDLFETIYQVEGYLENSSGENEKIRQAIRKKIEEYLSIKKDLTIEKIIEVFPQKNKDTLNTLNMSSEKKLLMEILGETIIDSRYNNIILELQKMKIQKRETTGDDAR